MGLIYLETEQYAEVPRRPVIEGVNQICTFVHSLPQGLRVCFPNVNSQLWRFITVFVLEEKESKGKQVINSAILSIHVTSNKKPISSYEFHPNYLNTKHTLNESLLL